MTACSRFIVVFEAIAGADGIHALRHLLKTARRVFGLRCVDCRQIPGGAANEEHILPDSTLAEHFYRSYGADQRRPSELATADNPDSGQTRKNAT
jgi:hypothetical protein